MTPTHILIYEKQSTLQVKFEPTLLSSLRIYYYYCLSAWRIYLTVKSLFLAKCCPKNIFSTNNQITFEQLKHFHEIMKWVKLSKLQCRTLLMSIIIPCKNT
jgi:hypothetical protein